MNDHCTKKVILRCRPKGKRRMPGNTQLWWVDLLKRDIDTIPKMKDLV